jgi:hypothetical protein
VTQSAGSFSGCGTTSLVLLGLGLLISADSS